MAQDHHEEGTRRDFLLVSTTVVGGVGVAAAVWPFVDQLNPSRAVLAQASTEVNVGDMEEGQSITAMWRGKPIFIRYRTAEEIAKANETALDALPDPLSQNPNASGGLGSPATDANRAAPGEEQFIVMIASCTHFGCVPTGEAGDFGGWFCPCHGSHYDTAGRIRKGPAPRNLDIPPYRKEGDVIVIG